MDGLFQHDAAGLQVVRLWQVWVFQSVRGDSMTLYFMRDLVLTCRTSSIISTIKGIASGPRHRVAGSCCLPGYPSSPVPHSFIPPAWPRSSRTISNVSSIVCSRRSRRRNGDRETAWPTSRPRLAQQRPRRHIAQRRFESMANARNATSANSRSIPCLDATGLRRMMAAASWCHWRATDGVCSCKWRSTRWLEFGDGRARKCPSPSGHVQASH